jgi:GNAT-family acetyltransferase (TIGR03103 family)
VWENTPFHRRLADYSLGKTGLRALSYDGPAPGLTRSHDHDPSGVKEFLTMRSNMNTSELVSLRNWGPPPALPARCEHEAVVDCGWGRLLFGQTFQSPERLAAALRDETSGERDVALYIRDPQVVLAQSPQDLFIDPSLTFRLALDVALQEDRIPGIRIERVYSGDALQDVNRIYLARQMVPLRDGFFEQVDGCEDLQFLVARNEEDGRIIGCVSGVDHRLAFSDVDNGSSLWALAVDPQCAQPGVGRALVLALARRFQQAGRAFMDLSVMHDNEQAISLYRSMGFQQVPVYCIKRKNAINEPLFTGQRPDEALGPYASIITEEACRRGILVEIVDAEAGMFRLSLGGRVINCRESLTDATSAVALTRCDNKALTHRLLSQAGLCVPAQSEVSSTDEALDFLRNYERIVIKPARGEQGNAVAVDLRDTDDVIAAYELAASTGDTVLAEEFRAGMDLRIVVINNEVVAAALRLPAAIIGTGRHSVRELISRQSRRRRAATDGESEIPIGEETLRCLSEAGLTLSDVPEVGQEIVVRKTANLHTGGTLQDVTKQLHPRLEAAALKAARALEIPVVGLDLIITAPESPRYVIIEANERPGLANHEPQPTAERLLDFLFPATASYGEATV